MNKSKALKEAVKRWGKNAGVQEQRNCDSTPESREAAKLKLGELNKLSPEEKKARRRERDDALSRSYWYRFTVGRISMGMFFEVLGQGDTWEEAFKAADVRLGKAA